MTEHDAHADDADHGHGGMKKYVVVFVALVICTGLSFAVGSSSMMEGEQAWMGQVFMIAISCVKSLLVMLFFMHLIWEANWKYVLTIPASLMSVFLLCMLMPDVMLRTWWYSEERWRYAAEEVHVEAVAADSNGEEQEESAEPHASGE
ncbi:MAG: hypothetical protein CMJ59_25655 [Planctomycetaceae bacterium]|nr:hypothetical protein [Planctomycetaceae bacterium]